jgi:hypothetical protein
MLSLPTTIIALSVLLSLVPTAAHAQGTNGSICKATGALMPLAGLTEASGLAAGRVAGRLWSHNDSGAAVLVAVDPQGKPLGRLTVNGARVEDWEAIAAGPCGKASCLYIGDIGDNKASRRQITVYRVTEPAEPNGSAIAEALHGTYPDGAHDAESLLVAPDGTIVVVTKGETGPVAAYRFPRSTAPGSAVKLERIGKPLAENVKADARVTDGAFSADGKWVILRTNTSLTFYPGDAFMRGVFRESHRVNLAALNEAQGEGVAFGSGQTVYVVSEGGGKKQAGTLGVLSCTP